MLFALLTSIIFIIGSARAGNWNTNVRALVTERLDPIVSPNNVASHMHAIIGGSGFSASYNYENQMKSTCTSFPVSVDKSNYWMPKLYWINNGGTSFTPLTQGHRVYYFRVKSSPNSTIQAFPSGLRMLAGNPNAKVPNTLAINFICRVNSKFMGPGDVQTDNFNIDKECPNGLLVQVKFPSCWDGINLYRSDQTHMSYPVSSGALWGPCPWSHPIRLPSIMLEYYYQTSKWAPGESLKGKLAWANGDTTGFGAHADFTNGWDVSVLQRALDDPVCGADQDMTFQECPVFKPFIKDAACSPDKGQMVEAVGNSDLIPIPALPGCNRLWSSGSKPTCSTPPPQPEVAKFTGVDGSLVASQSQQLILPTIPGWTAIGCIQDNNNMLLNSTRYSDPNVTQSTCFDSCLRSGYSYSAIGKMWGNSWDCHCGAGVSSSASYYPGMCNLTCPGNAAQGCGGSGAHQVFYAPSATKPIASFDTNLGCYADPPAGSISLEGRASYNFTSWDKMTTRLCLQGCADRGLGWGAIRNGATCYCGANSAFSLGKGNWVASNTCTSKCSGNSSEACGYWNGATVFNVSTSGYRQVALSKPPGYLYCFSGGNTSLVGPQFGDNALTPQRCSFSCSELGYPLAAVWNANMCLCGNTFQGGGQLPTAMCSGKCPGSTTNLSSNGSPLTCGAQWNIGELYNTSALASTVQASISARPQGWQGCYADVDALVAGYSISDAKMTVGKCLSSCSELGYPFAGVQNLNQCRCFKSAPVGTNRVASNVFCNVLCPGNSAETCGGWGRVEVYKIDKSKIPGISNTQAGYKGCFNGSSGLTGYSWSNWNNMTVETCTKGCRELGFSLSSLSNRATCACGNKWTGGSQVSSLSCAYECTGNNSQRCGGWPTMSSIYESSSGASVNFPKEYRGCYNDSLPSKILAGYSVWLPAGGSVSSCRQICAAKNFAMAGMENSNGCYCGNVIAQTSVRQTSELCSSPCPADSAQKCGAWNYISIYDAAADNKQSSGLNSTVTPSSLRVSITSSSIVGVNRVASLAPMKVAASVSTAAAVSSIGLSGNSTAPSASPKTDTSLKSSPAAKTTPTAALRLSPNYTSVTAGTSLTRPSSSSMPASTSRNLALSSPAVQSQLGSTATRNPAASHSQSASSLTSNSTTTASTALAATASNDKLYKGCFAAGSSSSRSQRNTTLDGMTIDFCQRYCYVAGATEAALAAGRSCACGSGSNLGKPLSDAACSTKCTGDPAAYCGSDVSQSVYSANATIVVQFPSSSYLGCFGMDNTSSLKSTSFSNNTMRVTACESLCRNVSSTFYWLKGGNTCYCGTSLPSSVLIDNRKCLSTCSGGGDGTCGGASSLAVYGIMTT